MARNVSWVPSAAYTTTQSIDVDVRDFRSIIVNVDITNAGTGSITVSINGKLIAANKYVTLLASAALIANGTTRLRVTPGEVAAVANLSAVDVLPQIVQILVTANNANPCTYSVDYELADPA